MIRNWPDAGLAVKLSTIVGISREHSDAERWALMEAGISMGPINVDGSYYALTSLGQTSAGTPFTVSQQVMHLTWEITYLRERGLEQRLLELSVNPAGDWVPAVKDEQLGLQSAEHFVCLGRLA